MRKVPYTRFRRELRKWLRLGEVIAITRNGVIVSYLIPKNEYDNLVLSVWAQ